MSDSGKRAERQGSLRGSGEKQVPCRGGQSAGRGGTRAYSRQLSAGDAIAIVAAEWLIGVRRGRAGEKKCTCAFFAF